MSVALVTNNPSMRTLFPGLDWPAFAKAGLQVVQAVQSGASAREKIIPVFFDADARAVVTAARDCIHAGWRLLHHPLYGNYRPYQQPYRTILLQAPKNAADARPDETSLHLIEEALLVYSANTALAPGKAPAALKDACALLDCELMRLPLEQAGVLRSGFALGPGKD